MATGFGRATIRDRIDPADPTVEALIKELIETASHPKAASRVQAGISEAMTEALIASLILPERAIPQESLETAMVVAALAPALAEALAPALAEALAPAIEQALHNVVSPKKTGQKKGQEEEPKGDSGKRKQD
jgi:hypothetical protein